MTKASVEEMKKQAQVIVEKYRNRCCTATDGTPCAYCWLNYCCHINRREERYQLAKAILEDRVIS